MVISCIKIWNNRNCKANTEDKLIPFGSLVWVVFFIFNSCETSKVPPWPLEKCNNILDVISEKFPMTLSLWSRARAV